MSNRVNGCVVVFDEPIREDDAAEILQAIRMVRGVLSVNVSIHDAMAVHVAKDLVRAELSCKLWDVLKPEGKP